MEGGETALDIPVTHHWHPCGESLLPKSFQGLFVNINPTRGQCLDIQKGGTECFTRKGLMMKQYILPLEY